MKINAFRIVGTLIGIALLFATITLPAGVAILLFLWAGKR